MALLMGADICASSAFAFAAAGLTCSNAFLKLLGKRLLLTEKLLTVRWVCAAYNAFSGTSSSPMLSCPMRVSVRCVPRPRTNLTVPPLYPRVQERFHAVLAPLNVEQRQVAPGHVFVLDDNRTASHDSRDFDDVPLSNVVGRPRQIWFSYGKDGARWDRIGQAVQDS